MYTLKEEFFKHVYTLRASLSGTFLQILPELVTPPKGHSLSPRICLPTLCQRPPKGLGRYQYDSGSNIASKYTRKHEVRLPRLKKKKKKKKKKKNLVSIQTIFGFICAGVSNVGGYKRNA